MGPVEAKFFGVVHGQYLAFGADQGQISWAARSQIIFGPFEAKVLRIARGKFCFPGPTEANFLGLLEARIFWGLLRLNSYGCSWQVLFSGPVEAKFVGVLEA